MRRAKNGGGNFGFAGVKTIRKTKLGNTTAVTAKGEKHKNGEKRRAQYNGEQVSNKKHQRTYDRGLAEGKSTSTLACKIWSAQGVSRLEGA